MMKRTWIAAAAFCAAMVLPAVSAAQTLAYATYDGYTNVRAGPSTRYQIIAQLEPGTAVDVLGCLETHAWCQILVDDLEGWVYARRLEFDYSGQRYFVPDYYAYFGAPLVYFNFNDYPNYRYHNRRRHYSHGDDPVYSGDDNGIARPFYPDALSAQEPVRGVRTPDSGVQSGGYAAPNVDTGVSSGGGFSGGGGGVCPPGDPSCPNME
jgi:uncharacterized protein YraI